MPIDLYQLDGSAPCRAVRLAAAAVGVDLNLKLTNLMAGDQMKPEFLKVILSRDDGKFHGLRCIEKFITLDR